MLVRLPPFETLFMLQNLVNKNLNPNLKCFLGKQTEDCVVQCSPFAEWCNYSNKDLLLLLNWDTLVSQANLCVCVCVIVRLSI